jgi:lipopolysaccharide biosynthesis glycosyltransferase
MLPDGRLKMIRVFIGYDPREAVAYHVLTHSILSRSSEPVEISPLNLQNLKRIFWREKNPLQSTEFSFSRFLVPYLSEYQGWSLFCDCDMLMLDDIANLWALRNDDYAVQVVKHEHVPKESVKFLEKTQTRYEKKNWSSVILFNNAKCKALTLDYANTATGLELHQFKWLENDALIGELPARWNHLVDYDPQISASDLSFLHFTEGGPYFEAYKNCGYADLWFAERDRMMHAG